MIFKSVTTGDRSDGARVRGSERRGRVQTLRHVEENGQTHHHASTTSAEQQLRRPELGDDDWR